jgi:hypothetical protein
MARGRKRPWNQATRETAKCLTCRAFLLAAAVTTRLASTLVWKSGCAERLLEAKHRGGRRRPSRPWTSVRSAPMIPIESATPSCAAGQGQVEARLSVILIQRMGSGAGC